MKQRHKIIALITVMLLFVLSCATLITVTIAKFVSEQNAPWGKYQTVDFTMENVYEVNNQDELFSALNNGYPFIRLSKDIDNPLIITDDAENLYQDLILDLNGIEIQRNGHDPILNILPGVRLTVTDTSEEQTGGLYNPVGSVFNIAGGTLTVASGGFESGPRYSEYYSYNSYILDNSTNSETKRTLVSGAKNVAYYTKNGGEFVKSTCVAPIIQSYPTTTNEIIYNHGNLYFDTAMTEFADTTLTHAINADTYCYYYTQDKSSYRTSIPKDADWYYSYYVTTATNEYFAVELTEDQKASELYTQVIIYGYEGVIKGASEKTQQKDYYAAVKMQEGMGKLDVQKGKFFCYFGVDKTAAVNAMGGIITVKSGEFSSRVPNATSATQNSVNAREDDHLAFTDDNYFNNFKWANDTFADGAQARKGESYCILNGGNAQVTITKGKFYSSNNNTISMSGGELTTSGTFTKNNTVKLNESDRGDAATKFAAVYMNNGTLNVSGSTFNVYGDYTAGVYIKAGTIDIAKSECNVKGANTNGIYSLVEGEGNFTVTDTNFTMTDGDSQMGIYAENGEVSLRSTSTSTFNIAGANSKAVYAAAGSTIKSEGYTYTLSGATSQGVYSTDGAVQVVNGAIKLKEASSAGIYTEGGDVNVSGVTFTLDGARSMGIYSTGGNVSAVNSTITMNSNVNSYGVHVSNSAAAPTVELSGVTIKAGDTKVNANSGTVDATIGVYLHSNGNGAVKLTDGAHIYSNEVGIAVNGGRVLWTGGGKLTAYNGSAIAVKSGDIEFGSESDTDSEFTVTSNINGTKANGYNSSTTHSYELNIVGETYNNLHGMYINGGAFACYGTLNYTFDGLCSDDQKDSSYNPLGNDTRSFAVYVKAAESLLEDTVNFSAVKGKVEVTTGGGVLVEGGNAVLGDDSGADNTTLAVRTMGTEMYGTEKGTDYDNWKYSVTKTGGPALQVTGGNLNVKYGSYIAARGKALFIKNGDVNVKKGNFVGGSLPDIKDEITQSDTTGKSYQPYEQKSGLACYYGLFVSGAGKVQIDEGNFLGQNGGAFFYGDDSSNACETKIAKGNFLSVYNASGSVLGLCGICVMGNADLTMNKVNINAVNAAISVEGSNAVSGVDNADANITIKGGEYITNGGAVIFNYRKSGSNPATWKITGGHFQVGGTGGKIFQTLWGSYAPKWSEILGTGYKAYYKNGSTYTDVSSRWTSNTSYNNIYVSARTPA